MKRTLGLAMVALTGALASGCPVFPHERTCYDQYDCPADYYCAYPDNVCMPRTGGGGGTAGQAGQSASTPCSSPSQCDFNSVCGKDGFCHTGDCFFSGCVQGYQCVKDSSYYVCKPATPDGGAGKAGDGSAGDGAAGEASGGASGSPDAADTGPSDGSGGTDAADTAPPPLYCGNPSDCPPGKVCTPAGTCAAGTCTSLGCISGYACVSPDGGAAQCLPTNPAACIEDKDCTSMGAGFKCINGLCTAPADQCWDQNQCPGKKVSCVDGKCTSTCTDSSQCPDGYACDPTLKVCNKAAKPCTITGDCASATSVCVGGTCVQRCTTEADGGHSCPAGLRCVANGCVPDQAPTFTCDKDGEPGTGAPGKCAVGSICLHHSCYISCDDPNPNACVPLKDFNVCKTVDTQSGPHKVCGSATNLGSECDPTAGKPCAAPKICIDGYCL
jgi:hypothetical protein